MDDWAQPASRGELPRREVMQTPDEVAVMLRLKALGWGVRRMAPSTWRVLPRLREQIGVSSRVG